MSGMTIACSGCAKSWTVMCGSPFENLCKECKLIYDLKGFSSKKEMLEAGYTDTLTCIGNSTRGEIVWEYFGIKVK